MIQARNNPPSSENSWFGHATKIHVDLLFGGRLIAGFSASVRLGAPGVAFGTLQLARCAGKAQT
jgi:hypothetical protein